MIDTQEGYVYSRRFDFSLEKLMERHPEGAPDSLIAAVLLVDESAIEPAYQQIISKLRDHMQVDE